MNLSGLSIQQFTDQLTMAAKLRGLSLLLISCFTLLCCRPAIVGASRALQEFKSTKGQVIRAEMIHRNHPESRLRARSGVASASSRNARRLADVGVQFRSPLSSAFQYGELREYVMTIYLGTPVRKFVLIVDTGSDLLWVQCQPCIQCYNQTNPYFDPAASATYSAANCDNCDPLQFTGGARCNRRLSNCLIAYAYGTPGSAISGLLATETVSFTNDTTHLRVSNLLFGCMDNNTASFGSLDGLVGFGRGPLSLPSQLRPLTALDAFSYCLVPFYVSSVLTSPLLFGGGASALELVYTPIVENLDIVTFYWVNMTGVSVDGGAVNVSAAALQWNSSSFSGGTIFDSGTTDTVFLEEIFAPVVQILREKITYPVVPAEGLCYNVSGVQQPVFPSVSFQFSGVDGGTVDFALGAQNLFLPNSTADLTVQCLAMVPAGAQSIGPNIIGNIAQGDHYIETDLENMRIGWTSRDCSLPL